MQLTAYVEAITLGVTDARKLEIREQLLDYCFVDTVGLVRLWQVFTGRKEL